MTKAELRQVEDLQTFLRHRENGLREIRQELSAVQGVPRRVFDIIKRYAPLRETP